MYSAHKEGKFVAAAIFIRMLKENIYWHLISISKNVFNYNNKYHRTIKMKPVDVNSSTYTDFNKQNSKENLELEVDDHVRILKFKPFLSKVYVPNLSEEGFVIKNVKNTVPWTYVIRDLYNEKMFGPFQEKELQKANQKELRGEKVIKTKDNK